MLKYNHSSQILSGLLGPHFLRSPNTELPLKDSNGNYKYGTTIVNFPRPQFGSKQTVGFAVSDLEGEPAYPYRSNALTFENLLMPTKENGQKYLVEWDKFSFLCTAYMDAQEYNKDKRDDDNSLKTYYLGNPNVVQRPDDKGLNYLAPVNIDNVRITDFDENIPFFIILNGREKKVTIYHTDIEIGSIKVGMYMQPDPQIYLGLGVNSLDEDAPDFLKPDGTNFKEPGRIVTLTNASGEPIIDEESGEPKTEYQTWPEYQRIQINVNSRFDKSLPLLAGAKLIALEEGSEELTPTIENQDMILFPESVGDETPAEKDRTGWGRVNYFGLFYGQKNDPKHQEPFLWGQITDNDGNIGVNINYHEVPVIRKSGLRISLE